jgi:hemerythrin superfamily protein
LKGLSRLQVPINEGEALMKLWTLLKHDHQEVDKLFAQIKKSDGGDKQAKLFEKLRQKLELHTKVEETHLYPVLMKHDQTKDMTKHAIEEHGEVKKLLKEMSALSVGDDQWTALCQQLQTGIEDHVAEEEKEIFPAAEEALDKTKIDEIGRKIEEMKQAASAG